MPGSPYPNTKLMKLLFRAALVVGVVALAVACGKFGRNAIAVSQKNFTEEVEVQQNLIFTFDKNIVADSLVDKWNETPFIEFTPAVKGKFRWSATNELVFSPETGFKPSTDYKAELTNKILDAAAEKLSFGDGASFAFHTPYLSFAGADVFWVLNQQNQPEVRLNLNFNYPVNPEEVAKLAKVTIDGAEAGFRANGAETSPVVQLAVPQEAARTFDAKPVSIKVAAGLRTPGSELEAKELTFESSVPDKNDFRILSVESEFDADEPFIHVYTNQTIGNKADEVKRLLSFTPAVNFNVEMLEYGFKVSGAFASDQAYKLVVNRNLKGVFGGALKADSEHTVAFGQVQPTIQFTAKKAIYLTNKGQKNVGVRILSIPKVNIKVYKVYQNNLLAYLRESGELNSNQYEEEYYESGYFYGDFGNYGDLVYEKDQITTELKKAEGAYLLNLNLADTRPFKGIYVVQVQSLTDQWVRASKVVSLSDVGLIAKHTDQEVLVFANSIMTAAPLPNIDVTLVSTNNQEVYSLKTDASGVARFVDLPKKAPGFQVGMVTALHGEDFNYMHFNQTAVSTSRYEVGGLRENETGLQAFVYGDRDLYRPDETMYLKTVVRDQSWAPVKDLPIKLKVLLPNGKDFLNRKGVLSGQGTFETSVKLPASTVTGAYTVEIYTANDVLLNSKNINVEEFMPDRIKVNTNLDKEVANIGSTVRFSAQALNMFGPPASNRKWETDFSLGRKEVYFKDLPNYTFTLTGRSDISFENEVRDGMTDAEGRFSVDIEIPNTYKNVGLLEGKVYSTVFDESGRAVNRANRFDILTQPALYGIGKFDYYVDLRRAVNLPLIAANHKGQVASNARARVQVVRFEWQNVLERDTYSNNYRYVSQRKEIIMTDKGITISGRNAAFPFVPNIAGEYQVRVMPEGTDGSSYVARSFYAYEWGAAQSTSFEINREGQVDIELNKDSYLTGDEAELLFKTPFKGRLLVTVERNKVFDHFVLETDNKTAALKLPIKKEYLPNVYVAATLIKPMDNSAIPLTVAHGYRNLRIDAAENQLKLAIKAPQNSRANAKQEIVVQTEKAQSDVEVTLAVVDEGILILKNFATPDPYGFFFQQRALEVESYDLYPRLFPELKPMTRNYGADGYNLGKRLNPLANKRIKPLAFWSGTLKTDANGTARYTVDLPQFSGEVRIMAVAVKDGSFGSAEARMKVADPVVVSTALPLFMSPGDEVLVPVTLTNTTAKNAEAGAKITVSGALELVGEASQTVGVAANGEQQVLFRAKAKNEIGNGAVKIEVNALGEKFTEKIDLTVRPSTSLLKTSGSGQIEADKSTDLDLAKDYIVSSVDAKLLVSRSPVVQLAREMNYLVRYPYGCVEQTTSTAFPQLYLAELLPSISGGNAMNLRNATANVQEAIRRLQTMQLYNGGLSYWQGGTEESWWGSVYAAHFLMEARKAGYDVDTNLLDNLLGYLATKIKKKSTEDYYFFDAANERKLRRIAPKETFYSLYVLGLAGRPDASTMNYYKSNQQLLALDSKYLLATTYLLMGDRASYQRLLPTAFAGERSETMLGGSFYSFIRDEAIALNALIEVDPQNNQIGIMARHLSQQLRTSRYYNTQEVAFGLLALGKLAKKANASTATATVYADGKKIADFNGPSLTLGNEVAGKKVRIDVKGGPLYYFWEMEGLNSSGAFSEEDNFLKVRREYYDRRGNRLASPTFGQNDLVVVKLTLQSTGGTVPNVVLTDMLPAGLEIENPRISVIPGMDWIKGAANPEHFDFRDDRVNLFTTALPETKSFYYVCRAVTRGTFRLGPVSADAMYNGEYHSYHGAGTVTVQ